jgi:hypothetical protein
LHENLAPSVRQSKHSCDIRGGAYSVKVLGLWSFYIPIALDNNPDRHLLANRLLDSVAHGPATDRERHHHGWKEHPVAYREYDQRSLRNIETRRGCGNLRLFFSVHE